MSSIKCVYIFVMQLGYGFYYGFNLHFLMANDMGPSFIMLI